VQNRMETRNQERVAATERGAAWNVTYGFGIEAETGTPENGKINPASAILLGFAECDLLAGGQDGVSRASLWM